MREKLHYAITMAEARQHHPPGEAAPTTPNHPPGAPTVTGKAREPSPPPRPHTPPGPPHPLFRANAGFFSKYLILWKSFDD